MSETDLKKMADGLMSNLKDVQESNLEIKTHLDGASDERKSLGEKYTTQEAAIKDMQAKYDAMEKAQARKSESLEVQNSEELINCHKNIDKFNAIRRQKNMPEVSKAEAKSLSEVQKKYFSKGGKDHLNDEEKSLLNTIISPDGGYIVAPEYSQTIVDKKFAGHGVMELVNLRNIAGNSFVQPIDYADYNNSEYLNELANGTQAEHEPDYKQVSFNPTEQIYKFRISRNLSEDALFNVENDVLAKGRLGAMRQSAVQTVIGDGVDKPKGILNYIDSALNVTGFDKVEALESSASLKVTWKDVLGILPGELIEGYDAGASYAMRKKTFFNSLLTDLDGASQYAIMNQINFFSGAGVGMSILGAPVKFDIALGDAETAGAHAVLYGSFKEAYTFTQRIGFSLIVDNVTSGQFITYRLRRRNDGRLVLGDALKALRVKA